MTEPTIARDEALDYQIKKLKIDIDSLKPHSQGYARVAKSLSSAAVPDHVVENALKSGRNVFDRLEQAIRADLDRAKTDNRSLNDECRMDTQIDLVERKLEGALLEHRLNEAKLRRAQAQDQKRQYHVEEEPINSLGIEQQPLYSLQVSRIIGVFSAIPLTYLAANTAVRSIICSKHCSWTVQSPC